MTEVSILIPAWRAEAFVGAAIASARAQSLCNIEIIIVNDGSPDGTEAVAWKAAADDDRVKIITHMVNQGPAAARNTALAAAKGQWVAVLDADDTMAPDRLEKLLAHATRTNADIVADDLLLLSGDATRGCHLGVTQPEMISLASYARDNELFGRGRQTGYLKPMFRAAFLEQHALVYDPNVRVGEDYALVATALALGARYALLPEALYRYSVRDGSISRTLRNDDVALMIAADDRFQERFAGKLSPADHAAVVRRRASLEDAAAFIAAVDALKQHNIGSALGLALRRPASMRHFSIPIGARLARLVSPAREERA